MRFMSSRVGMGFCAAADGGALAACCISAAAGAAWLAGLAEPRTRYPTNKPISRQTAAMA